jgi:type IV pilus assembly protein PilZ
MTADKGDIPARETPDRRKDQRTPIELKVQYRRFNSFFSDYAKNISKGGLFIQTPKPLPIGTEFLFRLGIPERQAPFELRGEVKWIESEGDSPGMGIQFIYASETERADFKGLVEKLMVDKLGPNLAEKILQKSPRSR